MKKPNYLIVVLFFAFGTCTAQSDTTNKKPNLKTEIYKINYKWEQPVTAVAAGITLYNFAKTSSKSNPTHV